MALKRAEFSATCDDGGTGTDDVRLGIPSSSHRYARVEGIEFDQEDIDAGEFSLSIFELVPVDETVEATDETYDLGRQLVFIDSKTISEAPHTGPSRFIPIRKRVVNVMGELPSTDVLDGRETIQYRDLRLIVDGVADATYTVGLIYESAGDYRF